MMFPMSTGYVLKLTGLSVTNCWFSPDVGSCYGEEVHRSSSLGEWSNVIGYEMGSSHVGVYTMVETSLVENFKHG